MSTKEASRNNHNGSVLLVDGNGLLYRAYHAFPKELTTSTGEPIGAVYGFTRILLSTLKTLKPSYIAVCFDLKGPTFRHEAYHLYKATRAKMPEDLASQIERMYQIVEYLEFPIYTAPTYEADDVIGTLSVQITEQQAGCNVVILTGDQDILQLVNEKVSVYSPGGFPKQPILYTPEKIQEKYGFSAKQIIEYKALRGDPSDNIPGVPGVGEVTATKLLQEFGTIDKLYQALEKNIDSPTLKPALLSKLKENKESAYLSHSLATIHTNAPVTFHAELCRLQLQSPERLIKLFEELGFKSLMRDLPGTHNLIAAATDVFAEKDEAEVVPEKPEKIVAKSSSSWGNDELNTSDKIDACLDPVLRRMEQVGVKLDRPYLKTLEEEFDQELAKMRSQLVELAGEEFNPDSPSQVSHILYEVLNIPTKFIRKGKTGYTTDAATLQQLAEEYPIAQLLLSYRELMKLQTTYIRPLQEQTDEKSRLHTSYAPDTSTGRISSRNPNLQNIPVRSEQGRRLRQAFIADKGKTLVAADYSQIELRVAAHLADEPLMKEVFQAGRDFHEETAARMKVDRRTAKIINFSILYGKGAFGFATDLNITVAEAKEYIESYFKTYSKLREYLDSVLEKARKEGYLETLFGRRREFPDIIASNFQRRSAAEREAVNLPIQGTAAEILKRAMCRLATSLEEHKAADWLILTVHDELVLEVPTAEVAFAATLLHSVMTDSTKLSVPLEVHLKTGTNWAEMSDYPLPAQDQKA